MKPIIARLFCYLILALTVTSCQKALEEPEPDRCVISEASFDDGTNPPSFTRVTYDDQFRVIKETYFEEDETDTAYSVQIKYETNKITVIEGEVGSSDYTKDTTVYTLVNGKVTSGVTRNPGGPISGRYIKNISFEYYADGYLSRTVTVAEYPDNIPPGVTTTTVDYKYEDGNVISETTTTENNVFVYTYEYLKPKPTLPIGSSGSYEVLTGPHVSNLVSKMTETGPSYTRFEEYKYTFASDGQITGYTTTNNSGYRVTTALKYMCR